MPASTPNLQATLQIVCRRSILNITEDSALQVAETLHFPDFRIAGQQQRVNQVVAPNYPMCERWKKKGQMKITKRKERSKEERNEGREEKKEKE